VASFKSIKVAQLTRRLTPSRISGLAFCVQLGLFPQSKCGRGKDHSSTIIDDQDRNCQRTTGVRREIAFPRFIPSLSQYE